MATAFPARKPTSRSITQGQYATKRFSSISGVGRTRIYGSQPFGSTAELTFNNVSDAVSFEFVAAYESARGNYDSLILPNELWDGIDPGLRNKLERDYVWRFSAPPSIQSIAPGISNVSVQLEGQRDA